MINAVPVIKTQGVGLRLPNEPLFREMLRDFIGAANVSVDRMAPIVGHAYSAMMKPVEGMVLLSLLNMQRNS